MFSIQKANDIHNNQYDYSKVLYVNVYTKVEIICSKHGSFFQTPKNHLYAKAGCKQCSVDRITGTFDIVKANFEHGNKYDYSKVVYKNSMTKVEIICPNHGSFYQTPDKHIGSKTGCPKCKIENLNNITRMTQSQFIERALVIHGQRYNYDEVVYKNSHTTVKIKCKKHGIFLQQPTNHLNMKQGCPICSTNVSRSGERWLATFNNPNIEPEKILKINNRRYKVDGYDSSTNTIYEYFGRFWHGCPTYTDHTKINPRNKIPFKLLYEKTLERINTFQTSGYTLIYEWGL